MSRVGPVLGRTQSAFTLVELVLTLMLIGILSVSIGAKFIQGDIFSQRFFLDHVLSSVRYAHKLAIATGCDVQISMPSPGVLRLMGREHCRSGEFNRSLFNQSPLNVGGGSFDLLAPESVSLSSSDLPIYIHPDGRVFDEHDALVTQVSIQVGAFQIHVVGETGYAYVPHL